MKLKTGSLERYTKFIKQKNFLAKIIRKKERAQIDKIRNEKKVTTDTTNTRIIKRLLRATICQ